MSNFQKDVQLLADLQGLIEKREKQVNPPEGQHRHHGRDLAGAAGRYAGRTESGPA